MAKRWISLCLCLFAISLTAVRARAGESMPEDMKTYYFGLIYRGPAWTPDSSESTEAIQRAHLANIRRLARAGKLVLAGPFGDDGDLRGLFIYNASSREEAEALVQSDPAVKAGRLRVELHPWWGPLALQSLYVPSESDSSRKEDNSP